MSHNTTPTSHRTKIVAASIIGAASIGLISGGAATAVENHPTQAQNQERVLAPDVKPIYEEPSTDSPITRHESLNCYSSPRIQEGHGFVDTPEGRWWPVNGGGWALADGSWCV